MSGSTRSRPATSPIATGSKVGPSAHASIFLFHGRDGLLLNGSLASVRPPYAHTWAPGSGVITALGRLTRTHWRHRHPESRSACCPSEVRAWVRRLCRVRVEEGRGGRLNPISFVRVVGGSKPQGVPPAAHAAITGSIGRGPYLPPCPAVTQADQDGVMITDADRARGRALWSCVARTSFQSTRPANSGRSGTRRARAAGRDG
jgi:hypothetical protein